MTEEHIKINPVPTKVKYSGNGVVKEFPTGFAFFENDNIVVYHNGKIIKTGYSITGVGETGGGKVIFNVAPATGDKIIILRKVVVERVTDFQEGGTFRAKNINDELDRQTAFCQQIQEEMERCVKVEVTDDQSPEELLAEVYNKLDSATEVAEQAIGAANQATTAAKDAKDAVVVAQQQITETQAFIEQARTDISQTVEDSIEYVEQEAVKAATEVVGSVVGQYTDRAETAAKNAEADANSAATSAASASANAIKAETNADEVAVYNFKNKITNCITEIPQDIKLELNNGTLTLAQGCKGYMGDGTVRTITGTPTLKNTGSAQMYLHITSGGTGLYAGYMTGGTVSERPSSPINYETYYNTSTKKCEYYNGSTWTEVSLPIAIVTRGTDGFTSIDQVFNGFGYIGSTVYALPGVKGLIPDGRNADGSLKNAEFTVSKVSTVQAGSTSAGYIGLVNGTLMRRYSGNSVYDESKNIWYNPETGNSFQFLYCGDFSETSAKITSFTPKLPFRAVDQNDFNKLDEEVVKTSGNQTIGGVKKFTSPIRRTGTINSDGVFIDQMTDDNVGSLEHLTYYTGASLINRMMTRNTKSGGKVCYLDVTTTDTGEGTLAFNGNTTTKMVNFTAATQVKVVTPAASDNSSNVATTGWVTSNGTKNSFKPNWGGKVSVAVATNYTAPSNGFMYFKASTWNRTPVLTINGTQYFNNGGNVIAYFFSALPVCKGDVINLSGDSDAVIYFIPFK